MKYALQLSALAFVAVATIGCGQDELVVGSAKVDATLDGAGGGDVAGSDDVLVDTIGDSTVVADVDDTNGSTDVGGGEDAADAAETAGGGCPGGAGCACSQAADCQGGKCLLDPATGAKVCAAGCSDSAPCADAAFVCVATEGSSKPDACVPKVGKSCFPCATNAACDYYGAGVCVSQGDSGNFCGASCAADGDCPEAYSCKPGLAIDGVAGSFCVPKDVAGCVCPAGASAEKASTACAVSNQHGICSGSRACGDSGLSVCSAKVPAAETCNGVDDDCDGMTDEGVDCDDGNPCTEDACGGNAGCTHAPKAGPCSDGDACAGKVCKAGACAAGTPVVCDDGNPCTADACDPKSGACSAVFLADGATCTDDDACTADDGCKSGACVGAAVECDDSNPCTTDSCDAKNGCAQAALTSTAGKPIGCEDGNPCTNGDVCTKGLCAPGSAVECDDGNPCTTDACDPISGQCTHAPGDGSCDDGSACTESDSCVGGVCKGLPLGTTSGKGCDDGNPCTTNGCDPKTGCTLELNKAPCDDGNACTDFDACTGGKCKGAAKDLADCDDGNPCTTDGCDLALGCTTTVNSAPCDDGNPCTNGDACANGSCNPGNNLCACTKDEDCAAQNPDNLCLGKLYCDKSQAPFACKLNPSTVVSCPTGGDGPCAKNACDPKTAKCAMVAAPDGKACDADGSVCTPGDACKDGACAAGADAVCDDKNPCTTDSCDPLKGCLHTANAAPCDADGDACTVADTCADKICVAGAKKNCDDGELCTIDSCDAKTGSCSNDGTAMNGKPCDADGSLCTSGDACKAGSCVAGDALGCDDGNACTDDSCSPTAGCLHGANSKACDADGDACTVGDQCAAKVCVPGAKKSCDDGDTCTADSCDGKTGVCSNKPILGCGGNCQSVLDCDDSNTCTADNCGKDGKCAYEALSGDCSDGSACTTSDVCSNGKCVGKTVDCNDDNLCTDDSCDAAAGCVHVGNNKSCDDGDACTTADGCKQGTCAGLPKKCDDGDECTTDSCNPGDGSCNAKPIAGCGGYCVTAADCDDKNPCTDEFCQSGKCSSANNTKACDDSDLCTTKDVCAAGTCAGTPTACDDGNFCTKDACDGKTGNCVAVALPNGATCDDDSGCTTGDGCIETSGKVTCVGKPKNCDDANACTTDSCHAASGSCVHADVASGGPCDDGQPCTFGETCKNGACSSTLSASIVTAAGSSAGFADGKGSAAKFSAPRDVAVLPNGDLVVADSGNHVLRRVQPDGTTTTLAGTPGKPGLGDGKAAEALLNAPYAVDADAKGVVVFADLGTHVVRKLEGGVVTRIAGSGVAGFLDGDSKTARFNGPHGVALRKGGAVVVGDRDNHRIRVIDGATVSTLAGSGTAGHLDGPAASARFNRPQGVAIDRNGEVVVADTYNHRIRRVGHDGKVVTIAGSGTAGWLDGDVGIARFVYPWGVAVDAAGGVWVSDRYNHRVRHVTGGKVLTTGGIGAGFADGLVSVARMNYPCGLAVDAGGVVHVADGSNERIRTHYPSDGIPWCFIGGNCVRDGLPNGKSPCQSCVTSASTEAWTNAQNGATCLDDDLCSEKESCADGVCKGSSKVCDDGDKCTTDACDDASGGCLFKPIVGCGGNCAGDKDCDDSNPCTDDACTAGKCANDVNTKPCDDGDVCTWGDTCKGGSCVPGAATQVSTVAGSAAGYLDEAADKARFNGVRGVARAGDGSIWVGDGGNHRIRRIAADGKVSTIAGGAAGYADGPANQAQFNTPGDLVRLPSGDMLVADVSNHRLRLVKSDGTTSTFAGSAAGYVDGKGASARFNVPYGIDVAPTGTVYVADYNNNMIRRVSSDGTVTTVAGSTAGYANGAGAQAKFNRPIDVAVLPDGKIAVADYVNHRIRLVTPDGVVSNLAGSGVAGYVEGAPSSARFYYPWAVAADSAGRVVVADRYNHRIRRIAADGVVSRVAGVAGGYVDGDGDVTARFNQPWGLHLDADGTILVADYGNSRVRQVKESGAVCNIGGTCVSDGLVNPKAACERCDITKSKKAWTAQLDGAACEDGAPCTLGDACVQGSCVAGKARDCDDKIACTKDFCDAKSGACVFEVIIGCGDYCETNAHCDDKNLCTTDTCVNTKCSWQNNAAACDDGDSCTFGDVCSSGKCTAGTSVWVELFAGAGAGADDGAPDKAKFNSPTGLALLPGGEIVVADRGNHRLRKIGADGVTTTLAGSVAGYLDGGATSARFNQPSDVDAHSNGDVVVADLANHRIRLLSGGKVSTLAGSSAGWLDGPASQARFYNPYGVAWSPGGAVYVADYSNNRIRRIDVAAGQVVTVAGDGGSGWIDGQGTSARLSGPIGIDVAADGGIFFADYGTSRVRHLGIDGKVSTLAGDGTHGFADGVGSKARFNRPWGLQALPDGGVLVADASNHRLRQVAADGTVSGFAGSGIAGYVNGDGAGARLYNPRGIVAAPSGRIYIADLSNHRIRTAQASASACKIGGVCWSAGWPAADNSCTVCDASASKSQFTPQKDGAACHDGKLCTAPDACASGKCAGSTVVCDDKDACTTDACDATTGACTFTKIIGCKGYCETNTHCDDKNPCTTDTCASNLCQNAPNTVICDDGNACTVAERCENGSCTAKTADTLVSTLAGSAVGWTDAKGTLAKFNQPVGMARDATGTIWVADSFNHRIRAMAADGTVSTVAGSGQTGFVDGKGDAAWFYYPSDVDIVSGGVLVADRYNNRIRKVAADGTVTTLAGASTAGSTDGGAGTALFNQPIGVATLVGIAFVADFGNHRIRRVMPNGTTSTLAGSVAGYVDGKGTAARFQYPIGIAVDGAGVVYVTEWDGHRVRRVATDGTVTTIAGTTAGYTDGEAAKSRFNRPWGIDVDAAGRLFVADRNNARIRMIAGGLTTTVAGVGAGYVDGSVAVARFNAPQGVLALPNGELAIGDTVNHRLRHIRVTASACQIGGACWANGAANPAKPCEVCNGSKTPTQWDASGCSNN